LGGHAIGLLREAGEVDRKKGWGSYVKKGEAKSGLDKNVTSLKIMRARELEKGHRLKSHLSEERIGYSLDQ